MGAANRKVRRRCGSGRARRRAAALCLAGLAFLPASGLPAAETLHFVVMSPTGAPQEAAKYEALSAYLRSANPLLGDVKIRIAKSYPEAVRLFAEGDVDGMFSASYVAAVFIAKGLAKPVARPLGANGASTYRTSIVAREGTATLGGAGELRGKRVAFCRLASAGEGFVRTLPATGEKLESFLSPVPVDSHQAALEAVLAGAADYAVVKSTVFAQGGGAGLAEVGSDAAEHPDTTLIMPGAAHEKVGALVARALFALEGDTGEKAEAVRRAFGCRAFVPTAGMDFAPTLALLRKAGVDPRTFDFAF